MRPACDRAASLQALPPATPATSCVQAPLPPAAPSRQKHWLSGTPNQDPLMAQKAEEPRLPQQPALPLNI